MLVFYFPPIAGGTLSRLLRERPQIPRPPEMSLQIKLLCLFDDAADAIKGLTLRLIIRGSEIVNSSGTVVVFFQPFRSLLFRYAISASIVSVRHQFHRQLVQITHSLGSGLINECVLR